jgi:hypothetical protein
MATPMTVSAIEPTGPAQGVASRLRRRMRELVVGAPDERLTLQVLPAGHRPPSFRAWTQLSSGRPIVMQFDPEWRGRRHRPVRLFWSGRADDPTDAVLDSILVHEVGHEVHCPRNPDDAKTMRLAVAKELKAHHKYSPDMAEFVVNLVADILVNVSWAAHSREYADGLFLAWYDQGASPAYSGAAATRPWIQMRHLLRRAPFPAYFEVFLRAQIGHFGGQAAGYQLLRRFLRDSTAPMARVGLPAGQQHASSPLETVQRLWSYRTRARLRQSADIGRAAEAIAALVSSRVAIADASRWPTLARRITAILVAFLPPQPDPQWPRDPLFDYRNPTDAADEAGCTPWAPPSGGGAPSNRSGPPQQPRGASQSPSGPGSTSPQPAAAGDAASTGTGSGVTPGNEPADEGDTDLAPAGQTETGPARESAPTDAKSAATGHATARADETSPDHPAGSDPSTDSDDCAAAGDEEDASRSSDEGAPAADGTRTPEEGAADDEWTAIKKECDQAKGDLLTEVPWVAPSGEHVSMSKRDQALKALYEFNARAMAVEFSTDWGDDAEEPPEWLTPLNVTDDMNGLEPLTAILFCLDGSGSMMGGSGRRIGSGIPWHEDSRYHHALVALFSVAKWLAQEGLPFAVNLTIFSSRTDSTGWCNARDIGEGAWNVALFHPPQAGTTIDLDRLEHEIAGVRGCLLIIASDGYVSNAEAVGRLLSRPEIVRRCVPVLIHTNGTKTSELAEAMRAADCDVHDLPDPSELPASLMPIVRRFLPR